MKRYSGNAERFSYTNYDSYSRPIESGEYAVTSATFSTLSTNTTLLNATGSASNVSGATKLTSINTYYDLPATNLSLTGYVQDPGFMKGNVSYTTSAINGTVNSTTWYNYDDHGRVSWIVKQLAGLSGYKTIDYTYNAQGNVITVDYQKGTTAERFTHNYSYDADGRLINVQTSANGGTPTQQANYYYYLHGPLKRTELGSQVQGLDYVYTPQGWLKAVNTPTGVAANDPGKDGVSGSQFAQDAFGMELEYFPNDYVRTGSNVTCVPTGTTNYYNGNVAGMSWQSNTPTGSNAPAMYTYTYDPKYQYNTSTYGTPSFSTPGFTATSNFAEKNIAYDANGNITGLQRTGSTGTITDDFGKYAYNTNTNQLNSVGNTAGSSIYGTYTYDQIGRLSTQARGGVTYYLTYDVTGKITAIYSNSAKTVLVESYTYDETGNRITVTNSSYTTYYVYDGSGNALAIYYGTTPTLQEVPVYGTGRIGTYYTSGSSYVYELRDNVGSIRVAVTGTKTGSQSNVYNYEDYYPFGTKLQTVGTAYRHGYQGAYSEYDSNTQYNNFDLRMYDSRIGRWLTVDPKNIGNSSYNGMGNNPVSSFDADGGDPNQGVNSAGTIVYDDGKQDGNIYLVNDGFSGPIKDLKTLTDNSVQLSKGGVWVGTDTQLISFIKSEWNNADGSFNNFLSLMRPNNLTVTGPVTNADGTIGGSGFSTGVWYKNEQGLAWPDASPTETSFAINITRNEKNIIFEDVFNVINSLSHEKRHVYQAFRQFHETMNTPEHILDSSLELDAIKYQQSLPSYQKTTPDYKSGIQDYKSRFTLTP